MPTIKFDQGALPAGVVDRSRSDVTLAGGVVTVTAASVAGTAIFGLLARPTGSAAALSGAGLTRSITPDVAGTYRVRVIDDADGSSVIHTFTVRTLNRGLAIPAWNERASELANDVDVDPGSWVNESETNEGGLANGWHPDFEKVINELDAIPIEREVFFSPQESGAFGLYRVRTVGSTAAFDFSFAVPDDFGSLVELVAVMSPGSTNAAAAINLASEYGAEGESVVQHAEVDTTQTYNVTIGQWEALDISSVFSQLAAGDRCAVEMDHQATGGVSDYLYIRMRYIQA